MIKIAFIVESNKVWLIKVLEQSIILLNQKNYSIKGIVETPSILAKHRGVKIILWYLNYFGLIDTLKLGFFAIIRFLKLSLLSPCNGFSFHQLAKKYKLQYFNCETPNSLEVIKWIKDNKVDIVISQTSFILNSLTIDAPKLGIINKHAAVLPSNKGLFPYFWARKNNTPQGISYHLMVKEIDEGPLLHQVLYPNDRDSGSMINFYRYVFKNFPKDIDKAISACINKNYKKSLIPVRSSYYGLPSRKDVRDFRNNGGYIIKWIDILRDFFD